jgi:hypothetical protein
MAVEVAPVWSNQLVRVDRMVDDDDDDRIIAYAKQQHTCESVATRCRCCYSVRAYQYTQHDTCSKDCKGIQKSLNNVAHYATNQLQANSNA